MTDRVKAASGRVQIVLVAACLAAGATAPAQAQNASHPERAPEGMKLVWSDEFDGSGRLDPSKWSYETGFVRNREAQWYQSDNAFRENGVLVIEARRERKSVARRAMAAAPEWARWRREAQFTSASVTTREKAAWLYGRFEIRARLKAQEGLWPALWFVGTQGTWPAKGEIDLMEYYDGSILANFAWAAKNGKASWKARKTPLDAISDDPDWDKHFHTWVMDWTEDYIALSLDDRELNRVNIANVRNGGGDLPNPFKQPQYLIMNLALGGMHGGSLDNTDFPSRFEIDYVRVYQREEAE